jgi:hypothetical protein
VTVSGELLAVGRITCLWDEFPSMLDVFILLGAFLVAGSVFLILAEL